MHCRDDGPAASLRRWMRELGEPVELIVRKRRDGRMVYVVIAGEVEPPPPPRCAEHGEKHHYVAKGGEYVCACGDVSEERWPCGRCGGPVNRRGDRHDLCDY